MKTPTPTRPAIRHVGGYATGPLRVQTVALTEILSMAVEALWSNKLRTLLTMLGIIIGVTAVIAMTSIGQGSQKATAQQLQNLGTDIVQVMAGAPTTGNVRQGAGSASTLTLEDAQAIQDEVLAADKVSAYLQTNAQVTYNQNNTSTTIIGTDANYALVRNIKPQEGRFFTQAEIDAAKPVAVLGPSARDDLLGSGNSAEGAKIRIRGQSYDVIGVLESKGGQGPMNPDEQIYIPLLNMSSRLVGNNALRGVSVRGIYVKVKSQDQLDAAQYQITNLLRIRHNIYPPDKDDFRLMNQVDIINTLSSTVEQYTVLVVAIAAISLIVGGIGIANIMLVSVVERTREIGIRKAIGATNSAVLTQFLTEAIVISSLGSGIGIALGIGVAYGTANMLKFPFVVSPLAIAAGFGLSFLVGLLAGVIPARNAAQLDPITALRSD